jgi:threonine synthase
MFVTHLDSPWDGTTFAKGQVLTLHAGRPLAVKYDLDAVRRAVRPDDFRARPPSLWRYRELLPLPADAEPVTLGEGMSPLLPCPRLGAIMGLKSLWIKDESQLPTGSFKSRGMTAAISMAKHLGIRRIALPTAGNAGGALAAYGARAGIDVVIFMPEDTPIVNQLEAFLCGAKVFLVNGLINDCGRIVREGVDKIGWFDCSTLKEPYRLEGKKTMGLELAEQRGWTLPDAILYPTGGGTGLIGMHKAFGELETLGWLRAPKRPRFISCQSDGCAPIVRAFEAGARTAELFPNAKTCASGLRVPAAVGDFMMLDAIRQSGGLAASAPDESIPIWMRRVAQAEGIAICPETAICFAVLERLIAEKRVRSEEEIVVFNTGAAQKYLEVVPLDLPRIDKNQPLDWSRFA